MKTHFLQLILKQQKSEAAKKLRRDGVHSSTLREKKTPSSFLSYSVDRSDCTGPASQSRVQADASSGEVATQTG